MNRANSDLMNGAIEIYLLVYIFPESTRGVCPFDVAHKSSTDTAQGFVACTLVNFDLQT